MKLRLYIFFLLVALGGCLYQLHKNSLQLQEQTILLHLCAEDLSQPQGLPLIPDPNTPREH